MVVKSINELIRRWKEKHVLQDIDLGQYHKIKGIYKHSAVPLRNGAIISFEKSRKNNHKIECVSVLSSKYKKTEPLIFLRKKKLDSSGSVVGDKHHVRLFLYGELIIDTEKGIDLSSLYPLHIEMLRKEYPSLF